jgi:hypothetical protein
MSAIVPKAEEIKSIGSKAHWLCANESKPLAHFEIQQTGLNLYEASE